MANIDDAHVIRAEDANGAAVSGAKFFLYQEGTTTEVATYSDANLTSLNSHPVVADSSGSFGGLYVTTGTYKIDITNAAGTSLAGYPVDNVRINRDVIRAVDSTGSANAYLLSTAETFTPADGDVVIMVANHSNSGSATLDVNGAGAVDIKKVVAGSVTALSTGDIYANGHYLMTYDTSASAWIILNKEINVGQTTGVSGIDLTLITGTAGTTNWVPKWNSDGDLVEGYEVLDEDDMSSDADDKLATQQSIKAYVDAADVGASFGTNLLQIRDEKAATTEGGTFTSGVWRTHDLTTVVTNEITGASLSSNAITLPAGTFYIDAWAQAGKVSHHKVKVRNTDDSSDVIIGGTADSATSTDSGGSISHVAGRFTLGAEKVIELQHQCQTTKSTDGFGEASSFSVIEVYADVRIWKVA